MGCDEFSKALARALGVDVSAWQNVTKVVLTMEPDKFPQLVVTRLVLGDRSIGAVEKVASGELGLEASIAEHALRGLLAAEKAFTEGADSVPEVRS